MISSFINSKFESQVQDRIAQLPEDASLHDLFGGCSDELWLWVLTQGRRTIPQITSLLPTLPDEQLQMQYTGKSGDDGLNQALSAISVMRDGAERCGFDLSKPDMNILDFGCGWGRITQTLLRDTQIKNLAGADVQQGVLDMCVQSGLSCQFSCVEPWPPTKLESASFDLIFAYSVFSHLSQENHMAWVEELASKLKPGGVLAVTTRPRSFITMVKELRSRKDLPAHANGAAAAFMDTSAWLGRYDAGEFCFDIAGSGGKNLAGGYYGEAIVPKQFIERHWSKFFDRIEFIHAHEHGKFDQSVIIARRSL